MFAFTTTCEMLLSDIEPIDGFPDLVRWEIQGYVEEAVTHEGGHDRPDDDK